MVGVEPQVTSAGNCRQNSSPTSTRLDSNLCFINVILCTNIYYYEERCCRMDGPRGGCGVEVQLSHPASSLVTACSTAPGTLWQGALHHQRCFWTSHGYVSYDHRMKADLHPMDSHGPGHGRTSIAWKKPMCTEPRTPDSQPCQYCDRVSQLQPAHRRRYCALGKIAHTNCHHCHPEP